VRFLGYSDGSLEVSLGLRRSIARVIRSVRPDRVVCQSPERNWTVSARVTPTISQPARQPPGGIPRCEEPLLLSELLAEGFEPHVVEEVWLMASPRATRAVDITATIERKIAALRSHQSQLVDPESLEEMIRSWAPPPLWLWDCRRRFAESFQVVDTR